MNADTPLRVLIVETDRDALEMMTEMLAVQHGYQTAGEQELEDALKHTELVDMIILGNLGPRDRADAFRRLRENHPDAWVWDLVGGCT